MTKDSPAQKAGLKYGDVIVSVDGKNIDGPRELQLLVASKAPGSEVDVKFLRDGKNENVKVKLGERPASKDLAQNEPGGSGEPDVLDGVTVADIDADIRKELDLPEGTKGVVVTQIDADSGSYTAGIRKGDVIHEINREPGNHRQTGGRSQREGQEGQESFPARLTKARVAFSW